MYQYMYDIVHNADTTLYFRISVLECCVLNQHTNMFNWLILLQKQHDLYCLPCLIPARLIVYYIFPYTPPASSSLGSDYVYCLLMLSSCEACSLWKGHCQAIHAMLYTILVSWRKYPTFQGHARINNTGCPGIFPPPPPSKKNILNLQYSN